MKKVLKSKIFMTKVCIRCIMFYKLNLAYLFYSILESSNKT